MIEAKKIPWNDQIKSGRQTAGLTQKQLSEGIGVALRQVQRIEAGVSFPAEDTLSRICSVLNIKVSFPTT